MFKTRFYFLPFLYLLFAFPVYAQVELQVGDKAPDFSLQDPYGKTLHLKDFQGKIILLDFWASWCMPCRMANPAWVDIYNEFNGQGFDIFSISLDKKKEAWIKAIKNDNLYWTNHASDLNGWENKVAVLYGVEAIPATFLLDENGVIIAKNLDEFELKKKLKYLYFKQVNLYPKVVNTTLYFTGDTKYSILDSTGREYLKGKGAFVDVSSLAEGIYLCKLGNKRVESFTKQKSSMLPKVTFYPKAVTDKATLSRVADFEVLNGRGRVLIKGRDTAVNMKNLGAGVYYLNLEGDVFKIFKK